MLSPVEVRRIQGIIAAVYCVAAPAGGNGLRVLRVMLPAPKGSAESMPRAVDGSARRALPHAFVQSAR